MTVKMSKELEGIVALDPFEYDGEEKRDSFLPLFLLFEFSKDSLLDKITGQLEHFEDGDELTIRGIFRPQDVQSLISARTFIKKIMITLSGEEIQSIELNSYNVKKYGICKDEISDNLYVFYIVLDRT